MKKQDYFYEMDKRDDLQKEVNILLQRKSSWND